MIEEPYNREYREQYFAIRSLFRTWTDANGNTNEKMITELPCTFIRKHENGSVLLETYDTERDDVIEKFMFLPSMKEKQRHCIYCQGQAGGGKSYLLDDYVCLYKLMHPKNDVLYFTLNNAEIDISLTLKHYNIVPMQKFLSILLNVNNDLDEIKKIAPYFQNKLLVFDDIGNLKNNKQAQKTFWNFIDQSIENFRKFNT